MQDSPIRIETQLPGRGTKRAFANITDPFSKSNAAAHDDGTSFDDYCCLPDDSNDGDLVTCDDAQSAINAQNNAADASDVFEVEKGAPVLVQNVAGKLPRGVDSSLLVEGPLIREVAPKPRRKPRCRKCGHTTDHRDYDQNHPGRQARFGKSPADVCRTPELERDDGFPVETKRRVAKVPRCKK